jgi:hypothetical protein
MNPSSNQQPMPGIPPQQGGAPMPPSAAPYAPPQNPAAAGVPGYGMPQPAAMPTNPYPPQQPAPAPQYQAYQPMPPQPQPTAAPAAAMPPLTGPTSGATTRPVAAHAAPNSTQNMLQMAEIRDGIVIMNDGSFRSVIMVKSINFDLMSPQEQEGVEFSFQSFLNSLYFPIQIFIRSQKVDIGPYIEKLDKIRAEHDNMLLALMMDDYIDYMSSLAQQTNIMDKKFYIVVPFFPHVAAQKALTQSKNFVTGLAGLFNNKEQHVVINEEDLEKAKTELRTRVQSVMSGLMQSGIQSLPLDTQELIELYYDTYNPDTATRQELKNFNELNADFITKGQGRAAQPHLDRELM